MKLQGRGDKEEATRKRRQGRGDKEEVTRRNPSQCGSRARSRRVAGDLSSWRGERRGACMVAVRLLKNCIAPYSDQVPYHPSPLLSKFLIIQVPPSNKSFLEQTPPLSTNLGFSFPVLSPGWKVFSSTISIRSFGFLPQSPSSVGRFFIKLIPYPVFFLSLPISGLGGFSPAT